MRDLTIACAIVVGLLLAYGWGYLSGVAYCVREMRPLVEKLGELREGVRRR